MGFQSPDDFSQDAVDISQHVVIPEAHDDIAARRQVRGTLLVSLISRRVLPSVELDNEPRRLTTKIDDVIPDRRLPTEFQSVQTPVTQTKPQDSFCVGLLTPQTSCCINTPRHNPSPALASLGHPLPLGEGRRPQAQQVADREYEISTIHRVEMERGDAAVDEVENLLGSNRRGD